MNAPATQLANLSDDLLQSIWAMPEASCRDAYRRALVALAEADERVVCLEADLGGQNNAFRERFPERYLNFGLAEANMVSAAAGLAATGLIPFVHTMANFVAARACEQIKIDVAYPRANVKIVASYGGIAGAAFGPTHHATEDLSILRAMPGLALVNPADAVQTVQALVTALVTNGPWYIRLGRDATPVVHHTRGAFTLGEVSMLRAGADVTILASGQSPVPIALTAADELSAQGIDAGVYNVATLKPLDAARIAQAVGHTGRAVTVEEHNIIGGLGSSVAEVMAEHGCGRLVRIGVPDIFVDRGGDYRTQLDRCGISVAAVLAAVHKLMNNIGPDK